MTGFACWYLGVLVHVYLLTQTWGQSGVWTALIAVSLGLWVMAGCGRLLYIAARRAGMVSDRAAKSRTGGVHFGETKEERD